MRIIPGNTKVQIEIFKGITVWDLLVGAIAAIMLALIVVSTLPFKLVFAVIHVFISILLLVKLDKEPNYMYLIHILRHYGYGRHFNRLQNDEALIQATTKSDSELALDEIFQTNKDDAEDEFNELVEEFETKDEIKKRKKAEKEEYKADEKLLKSKKLTKEEEDAIWLKRAKQAEENKKRKQNTAKRKNKKKATWQDMSLLSPYTNIKDGFIEYGNKYYGIAIEIPNVEFKFFSEYRRDNAIENGLGSILRAMRGDYSANIVKIERPIGYEEHLNLEYRKLDELRASFEAGFIKEEELKSRVAIVYDRIYDLQALTTQTKVVVPYYYLVLFDSDKKQLQSFARTALESLRGGEMYGHLLNDKELALFLKYSNDLDFDEADVKKIRPEDYATWAMPKKVEFTPRVTLINGIATHNFRVIKYPTSVYDAWLASLLTYPSTKVVIKMKKMDSGKAINAIDKSLSELRAKVNEARTDSQAIEAQTHLETLQILLTSLQGENESLLNCNIYISAYDVVHTEENPKLDNIKYASARARVGNMKKNTRRAWQEAGFRLNNNEFNQALAYIGSQISGYDPFEKDGRGIPSNTIAASFPWVFPFIMDKRGVKLGISQGAPVFVDFFRRDSERVNSNMVIVGKSGSGKSYATKSLLANLAADDAKIFILDPEDEYTDLAKNLHGKFINVANAQYGRLNPFHIITSLDDDESEEGTESSSYATHLQFLEEFFKQILPDCDRDSLEYLNALVDRVYATKGINQFTDFSKLKPEDYPVFDDLYDEILKEFQRTDSDYIRSMLRTLMNYISKFSEGGRNAIIWNGPSTITTEENFTVFNFQSLLANRNTTVANAQMLLVLKYIDNEIIKNRDYNEKYGLKRKIVVVIDEAHVFIDAKFPVALDFMFQLAKRIRKYNGMQIVITQNIKDFVGSEEIARKSTAIINACQYSFIFPLAPNDMDDLCKLYEKAGGINESEQEQIVQGARGQAFAIMSPSSRTSFKIAVPDDIRDLFSNPNYKNPYFDYEDGEKHWADYIKDSVEKRAENLSSRGVTVEEESEDTAVFFKEITLDEISEDEYQENFDKVEEIPLEVVTESSVPSGSAEDFAASLAAATKAIINAPLDVPDRPSKTEEMLAELTLKLGSENIISQIKQTVREELDRELAARPLVAASAASAATTETSESEAFASALEDEDKSIFESLSEDLEEEDEVDAGLALGNIFDLAGISSDADEDNEELEVDLDAEDFANAMSEDIFDEDFDAEQDEEPAEFDVMAFLAQQAEEMEAEAQNDTSVEDFIESDETTIEITLEQLISYNKRSK